MRSSVVLWTALSLVSSTAQAQSLAKTCPESDICFQLSIPETTASSKSGDIFFQLQAPTSYQWVSLGQGTKMSGSNIFVMYTAADGKNITLSPRLGTGHVEPHHDTNAQITLLDGTGVRNGMMTANVKCSNCNSWSGGSMDFSSDSSQWIHAFKKGEALDTDDLDASISRHDDAAPFSWSLASAKGGDSVNPFVASSASGTASAATSTSASTPLPSSGGSNTGSSSSSAIFQNAGAPFGGDYSKAHSIILAHGTLASLAFIAIFPIGGILIRIASFTGLVWVHAACQFLGYLIYIAAFGLGIYFATELDLMSNSHPIIGIVLFIILLLQPLSGLLHHRFFKKYGTRTAWSYEHLGIGRIAIVLGIINGGLGIRLAGNVSRGGKIAYAVVAAIMGTSYIVAVVVGERRRGRSVPPSYCSSQKEDFSLGGTHGTSAPSPHAGNVREHYGK